jgi:hypothetical protein
MGLMKSLVGKIGVILASFVYLSLCLWCALVIYFHFPLWPLFFASLYLLSAVIVEVVYLRVKSLRILWAILLLPLPVIVWWILIVPVNNANWQTPWARMPVIQFDRNLIKIENIRDFNYRSENDYEVRYISDNYDLDKLNKVMLGLSFWDNNVAVAHTILVFGFSTGQWLAISSETRLQIGQKQTALGGLFKQYGSLYIIGTEADVLMLRTNYRNEQLYLYPLKASHENAKILLTDLLERSNLLREKPQFYNTLTSNCMTSLMPSLRKVAVDKNIFKDIRFLLNGYSAEMIYEKSDCFGKISYEDFKEQHNVTAKMRNIANRDVYSAVLHGTPPVQ